ncbi:MAG: hypothetical protein OHK0024_16380 [Thalassobaculales bacterium]
MAKAVFLDRDGVINHDLGYVVRPADIRWTEDAAAAIGHLNAGGFKVIVVTNQAGVARGYYTAAEVEALHRWMADRLAEAGARIDAFYYCPYHPTAGLGPYRREHPWRKPAPGMILAAIERFGLDRAQCRLIGDRSSDLQAAAAAGITGLRFSGGSLLAFVRERIG